MESEIGNVGGSGNKQFNIPTSNVDRVFYGFQYPHNPYGDVSGHGMDVMGDVNPMYIPNYNMYVYFIISTHYSILFKFSHTYVCLYICSESISLFDYSFF